MRFSFSSFSYTASYFLTCLAEKICSTSTSLFMLALAFGSYFGGCLLCAEHMDVIFHSIFMSCWFHLDKTSWLLYLFSFEWRFFINEDWVCLPSKMQKPCSIQFFCYASNNRDLHLSMLEIAGEILLLNKYLFDGCRLHYISQISWYCSFAIPLPLGCSFSKGFVILTHYKSFIVGHLFENFYFSLR